MQPLHGILRKGKYDGAVMFFTCDKYTTEAIISTRLLLLTYCYSQVFHIQAACLLYVFPLISIVNALFLTGTE